MPWAAFTDPEVAQVGELHGDVHEWPIARLDRAQTMGLERGLVRVYTRRDGRVAGALICLEAASELANELSLAIEARLKLKDLANVIHVYPTFGIVLQQLGAEAAFSEAVEGLGGRVLRTFVR